MYTTAGLAVPPTQSGTRPPRPLQPDHLLRPATASHFARPRSTSATKRSVVVKAAAAAPPPPAVANRAAIADQLIANLREQVAVLEGELLKRSSPSSGAAAAAAGDLVVPTQQTQIEQPCPSCFGKPRHADPARDPTGAMSCTCKQRGIGGHRCAGCHSILHHHCRNDLMCHIQQLEDEVAALRRQHADALASHAAESQQNQGLIAELRMKLAGPKTDLQELDRLRRDLEEATKKYALAEARFGDLRRESEDQLAVKQRRITDLELAREEQRVQAVNQKTQINELLSRLAQEEGAHRRVADELSAAHDKYHALDVSSKRADERVAAIQRDLDAAAERQKEHQQHIEELTTAKSRLEYEQEVAKADLKHANDTINELLKEKTSLSLEVREKRRVEEQVKHLEDTLAKVRAEADNQRRDLHRDGEVAKLRIADVEAFNRRLELNNLTAADRVVELEEKLGRYADQYQDSQTQLEALKQQHASLRERLVEAKAISVELHENLERQKVDKFALQAKLDEISASIPSSAGPEMNYADILAAVRAAVAELDKDKGELGSMLDKQRQMTASLEDVIKKFPDVTPPRERGSAAATAGGDSAATA